MLAQQIRHMAVTDHIGNPRFFQKRLDKADANRIGDGQNIFHAGQCNATESTRKERGDLGHKNLTRHRITRIDHGGISSLVFLKITTANTGYEGYVSTIIKTLD